MNKDRLFDLAFSFRDSKIWKQLCEEELFAVKVPKDAPNDIAYCFFMGTEGEHIALAVYPGVRGFSTYREFTQLLRDTPEYPHELLIQDCIHCSLEQKDQFYPEDLDELKAYCKKTGRPFRTPLPQFTRYYPFCTPWEVNDEADWAAMEAALRVAQKIAEVLRRSGEKALGLRSVFVEMEEQTYAPEQMDLFGEPSPDGEVTIPLYSIVGDELVIERIPLPPYEKRRIAAPAPVAPKTLEKLKRRKQKGIYQCELIRLPEPTKGEPPYFPVILLTVDEEGFLLRPTLGKGPMVNSDETLNGFIESLGSAYPQAIKVRTEETETLLSGFCRDANILLAKTDDMEELDEAIENLFDEMLGDDDDDDLFDDDDDEELYALDETVEMLRSLSVAQMRMMPRHLLDQLLEISDLLPEDVVKKLRMAKGKR